MSLPKPPEGALQIQSWQVIDDALAIDGGKIFIPLNEIEYVTWDKNRTSAKSNDNQLVTGLGWTAIGLGILISFFFKGSFTTYMVVGGILLLALGWLMRQGESSGGASSEILDMVQISAPSRSPPNFYYYTTRGDEECPTARIQVDQLRQALEAVKLRTAYEKQKQSA